MCIFKPYGYEYVYSTRYSVRNITYAMLNYQVGSRMVDEYPTSTVSTVVALYTFEIRLILDNLLKIDNRGIFPSQLSLCSNAETLLPTPLPRFTLRKRRKSRKSGRGQKKKKKRAITNNPALTGSESCPLYVPSPLCKVITSFILCLSLSPSSIGQYPSGPCLPLVHYNTVNSTEYSVRILRTMTESGVVAAAAVACRCRGYVSRVLRMCSVL